MRSPDVRLLIVLIVMAPFGLSAQQPAPSSLLREIRAIRAIDNHAHVMRPVSGDTDYDALPFALLDPPPPGTIPAPANMRDDNPAYLRAWKALFAYPHADASEAHVKDAIALKQKAIQRHGAEAILECG